MLQRLVIPALALLTVAALQSVEARRSAASPSSAPVGSSPSAAAAAGLRAVMDPATGELVRQPTADDLGRLRRSLPADRRRSADLERFALPHGARGVVLDGWADHALRVERGADGALRVVCERGDVHQETR